MGNRREGLSGLVRRLGTWWKALRAPGKFLCDSCRYDYRGACGRPERPNATRCAHYRQR